VEKDLLCVLKMGKFDFDSKSVYLNQLSITREECEAKKATAEEFAINKSLLKMIARALKKKVEKEMKLKASLDNAAESIE